jgi:hypothetical protein
MVVLVERNLYRPFRNNLHHQYLELLVLKMHNLAGILGTGIIVPGIGVEEVIVRVMAW